MRFSITRYPGVGKRLLDCDVCGRKIRLEEAIRISDRYNPLNGMLVCKDDADLTNPQAIPFKIKETAATSPKDIRPQPEDLYITNPNDNRAPSAPRNVRAYPNPISGDSIFITWDGPLDNGSSQVIDYTIQIQNPQGSISEVLVTSIGSSSPFYEDTVSSVSGEYAYTVAAINGYGTGPYSSPGYYPTIMPEVVYLGVSQDASVLTTGSGEYIIL